MKLDILAIPANSRWQKSSDMLPQQLAAEAFSDWLQTPQAFSLPLFVRHRRDLPIPLVGYRFWLPTAAGLRCRVEIDASNMLGRAIGLAVRHRHLMQASVSFVSQHVRTVRGIGGLYGLVERASLVELSLTNCPMLSTSIRIVGEPLTPIAPMPAT